MCLFCSSSVALDRVRKTFAWRSCMTSICASVVLALLLLMVVLALVVELFHSYMPKSCLLFYMKSNAASTTAMQPELLTICYTWDSIRMARTANNIFCRFHYATAEQAALNKVSLHLLLYAFLCCIHPAYSISSCDVK